MTQFRAFIPLMIAVVLLYWSAASNKHSRAGENPKMVGTAHSWILAGSKHSIVNAEDSTLVGWDSVIEHTAPRSVVIGDWLVATEPDSVLIGNELCGEPIPKNVQKALKETDPEALQWLIRKTVELNNQR